MHEKVLMAIDSIVKKAKIKSVKVGVFCDSLEMATEWKNKGINYVSYSVDYGILLDCSIKSVKRWEN